MSTIYAMDTETTVYDGQTSTAVWSFAMCPVRTIKDMNKGKKKATEKDVVVMPTIDKAMDYLLKRRRNIIGYFHNLKFDGAYIIDWLMKHGYTYYEKAKRKDEDRMHTYSTVISDLGMWYMVRIVLDNGKILELRDSYKLMPMSLAQLGEDLQTEHRKTTMEYTNKKPGYIPTKEELTYIRNDVLVLAEALEIMFEHGIDALTIGSACMKEYRKTIPTMYYKENFWDLTKCPTDNADHDYGSSNADEYIRKAYKGGWCYVNPKYAGIFMRAQRALTLGSTADVNSLYPSMMHSMSGNRYPIGRPHFMYEQDAINSALQDNKKFVFIRIKCAFTIRNGYLPFVQIKNSQHYNGTDMLTDSMPTYKGKKYKKILIRETGKIIDDRVVLTLTEMDYRLLLKHYKVTDLDILDAVWFWTDIGMFDEYINHWMHIKQTSTGARKRIAKLMLNNAYGKFATSPLNIVKVPKLGEDGVVYYEDEFREDKRPGYIAIGAAITSYARNFTINAAQANYDHFCYADTDSIHCILQPDEIKGIRIHPTDFCAWKIESTWDEALFVRAKTYIEVKDGLYDVKGAGLPQNCKDLFVQSITQSNIDVQRHKRQAAFLHEYEPNSPMLPELEFLSTKRTIKDYKIGLQIPGKLVPVRINGGVLLTPRTFTLNK